MKKALSIAVAVVVVALLVYFNIVMWHVQKRDREDLSVVLFQLHSQEAKIARSLLKLVNRLEKLQSARDKLKPDSKAYQETTGDIAELQNIIASQLPALVAGRDANNNALLVPLETARAQLAAMASWRPDSP